MTEISQVSFSDIAFNAFIATKGVKTSAASLRGAPVEFLFSNNEFFNCPFGASAYLQPDATRLNLEMDVSSSPVLGILEQAEQAIIKKAHADGVFECSLEDAVKNFKSSIVYSEKYSAYRWRTKLNTSGGKACRFFLPPEKTEYLTTT